jgi:hypothetical protein
MNYKDLPKELRQFTKSIDYETLLKDKSRHDWCNIPINDFLTNDGLSWFSARSIFIQPTALVFKIIKNHEGIIHLDNEQFAFNFVLSGHGKMQWVDNIIGNEILANHNGAKYGKYTDVTACRIIDTWSGDLGIVRINIPHRVVTTDEERYCVSIRTIQGTGVKTFEEAIEAIYSTNRSNT